MNLQIEDSNNLGCFKYRLNLSSLDYSYGVFFDGLDDSFTVFELVKPLVDEIGGYINYYRSS